MNHIQAQITRQLVEYFGSDDRRIQHALRVLHHAERLMSERVDCDPEIVIAAALLHDVGIRVAEEKHGYNDARTQEEYGPPVAEELLRRTDFSPRQDQDGEGDRGEPSLTVAV